MKIKPKYKRYQATRKMQEGGKTKPVTPAPVVTDSKKTDVVIPPTVQTPKDVNEWNTMNKWNQFQTFLSQQTLPDKSKAVGNKALDKSGQKKYSEDYIKQYNAANPTNPITPEDINRAQTFAGINNDQWVGSETSQIRYNMPGVQTFKVAGDNGAYSFYWAPKGKPLEQKPENMLKTEEDYNNLKSKGIMPDYVNPMFEAGGKVGNFFHNFGTALGDTALSALGANDVINGGDYRGPNADAWTQGTDIAGKVAGMAAPMVMNSVLPGSGQFVKMGQKMIGGAANQQFGPQSGMEQLAQPYGLGGTAKQYWIANQGPMAQGGAVKKATINVEGNELEVSGGKIVKDFKNKPPHPEDPSYTNSYGDTQSKEGNIIIPKAYRNKYLKGDKLTRTSIEQNLINSQKERETGISADMTEMFGIFEKGGAYYKEAFGQGGQIHVKPAYRSKFKAAAERANMDVKDYTSHVMRNGGTIKKYGGKNGSVVEPNNDWMQWQSQNWDPEAEDYKTAYNRYLGESTKYNPNYYADQDSGPPTEEQINSFTAANAGGNTGSASNTPVVKEGFDWKEAGLTALGAAPSIYNIGKGLFGKPEQMNKSEYQTQQTVPYRDIDFKPIQNALNTQERIAAQNIGSASGGNAGSYLSNRTALGGIMAQKRAESLMNAQQINNQGRNNADQFNIGADQFNRQMGFKVDDMNAQNRAKKSEYLSSGLEGVSGLAQQMLLNKNRGASEDIAAGTLDSMGNDFKYVNGKLVRKT